MASLPLGSHSGQCVDQRHGDDKMRESSAAAAAAAATAAVASR